MLEEIKLKIDSEIKKILEKESLSNEELNILITYKEYIEDKFEKEEAKKQSKAWMETMSKLPI